MTTIFDIRTLFFIGAVTCAICAVMLYSSRGLHRPSRSALVWGAALEACMTGAMLLIALRGVVPDSASYAIANALGTGGAAVLYESVRRLAGARPQPGLALTAFAAGAGAQILAGLHPESHLIRLLLSSVFQGGYAAAAVPLLLSRRGIDPPVPLAWAIGFAGFYALVHLTRSAHALASGVTVTSGGMVTGNTSIVLVAALFALSPMIYAMIVLGLVNGRIAIELRTLATTDTLTGLSNRRSFLEHARGEIRSATGAGRAVGLMMLDLDRFKSINDAFGHAAGDRALVHFARVLKESAPPGAAIGRYGGEEFCLLASGDTADSLATSAQEIVDALRARPVLHEERPIRLTVSIGVATSPVDALELEDLLLAADRRLYLAKTFGRDRVVTRDEAPDEAETSPQALTLLPV